MKQDIFKQKKTNRLWGIFVQVAGQLGILIGILNLFMISITTYTVSFAPWLQQHNIHLGVLGFIGILVFLLVSTFYLIYKYALPSFFSSWNNQFYQHDNPIRADLKRIKKQLSDIESKIKK